MRTRFSRRTFMHSVAAGTCGAAIHTLASGSSGFLAYAAQPASASLVGENPVLILVNLAGGCSYNAAPIYAGAWRDKNPTISYGPAESLPLSNEQGLHPALGGVRQLFDEGSVALLNSVGYPLFSRSHDESTAIWFRGNNTGAGGASGWAARLTEQMSNSLAGISLAGSNTLIQGGANPPRSIEDLQNFGEREVYGAGPRSTEYFRNTRRRLLELGASSGSPSKATVRDAMDRVDAMVELIAAEAGRSLPSIETPFDANSSFGRLCQDAARLLNAPALGVRFIFLQLGGFDTHSDERPRLNQLLQELNAGLTSLVQCAKALGRWQETIIATMSEFSRTFENSSLGSDHGERCPQFVMGGSIAGRIVNACPTENEIAAADQFLSGYEIDFRAVYAEIIKAMGYDATAVFSEGRGGGNLGLFR